MDAPAGVMLSSEFCAAVTTRLSAVADLRLPASFVRDQQAPPQQQAIQTFLANLLHRDPAVFLERYGVLLHPDELSSFQPLRDNYEVDFWLKHAEAQQHPEPVSSSNRKKASATVANRRLAYMYRLQQQGEYFSEPSMRAREPLIWHEYIGQYEGQLAPPTGPVPGEGLAGSLLRAHDEVLIRAKLDQQLEEEECQMSEHESDSEDEQKQQAQPGTAEDQHMPDAEPAAVAAEGLSPRQKQTQQQQPGAGSERQLEPDMSADAMRRRRQDFLEEMQSRFLLGMDGDHQEYAAIDADAELDEAWAAQQAQDAEDAYFDAD